ncbi:MAG TPA: hypothetical protein VJ924_07260, partial [Alphaproteobacteria bacterium]|nr:hypothetical protein [Alphaproteobacteria bacterium]
MKPIYAAALAAMTALGLSPQPMLAQDAPRVGGAWTQAAPLPEARTELSAATDGRTIYVAGGFGSTVGGGRAAPRRLFAYDAANDRWRPLGDIPQGVNHAGLAVVAGNLYIVGGFRETTFESTAAVHAHDLASGRWRPAASLPTARGALAVAVHDGKIHAIGGTVASRHSVAA